MTCHSLWLACKATPREINWSTAESASGTWSQNMAHRCRFLYGIGCKEKT